MYHIVYLTTNLVNQKIYVGIHSTYNLDDGYLGSGTNILKAIEKYGKENFQRQILYYCLDINHLIEYEKIIVDRWFINRNDTYNLALGGELGISNTGLIRSEEFKNNLRVKNTGKIFSDTHKKNISKSAKRRGMWMCHNQEVNKKKSQNMKGKKPRNFGIPCSEQRKQKLSLYMKNNPDKIQQREIKRINTLKNNILIKKKCIISLLVLNQLLSRPVPYQLIEFWLKYPMQP